MYARARELQGDFLDHKVMDLARKVELKGIDANSEAARERACKTAKPSLFGGHRLIGGMATK